MSEVNNVGDLELLGAVIELFGTQRAVELGGWALWWGMTGEIDNLKAVRERLQEQGLSRSSVYRALADFKRLREHLEAREKNKLSNGDLLRRFGVPVMG